MKRVACIHPEGLQELRLLVALRVLLLVTQLGGFHRAHHLQQKGAARYENCPEGPMGFERAGTKPAISYYFLYT